MPPVAVGAVNITWPTPLVASNTSSDIIRLHWALGTWLEEVRVTVPTNSPGDVEMPAFVKGIFKVANWPDPMLKPEGAVEVPLDSVNDIVPVQAGAVLGVPAAGVAVGAGAVFTTMILAVSVVASVTGGNT
jgi:hypothetical protein